MSDSSKPVVTTIIPTYRRPRLLGRAIRSALNQTYPNIQVCVFDNASGDETEAVVARIAKRDPRVRYVCHRENIGPINNMNFGLRAVETPFFSILGDDNVLLPHCYETTMKGFDAFPDAMFSAGATIAMTEKAEVRRISFSRWQREGYFQPPDGLIEMLARADSAAWSAIVFRREVVEAVGPLDPEAGVGADIDFELRIVARFGFVVVKAPCAIYLSHSSNYSATNPQLEARLPGYLRILSRLKEDERLPVEIRRLAEEIWTERVKGKLWRLGKGAVARRRFESAGEVADVLRKGYDMKLKSFVLDAFRCVPAVHYPIVRCARLAGRVRRAAASRRLQKQYGRYARFLDLSGDAQGLQRGMGSNRVEGGDGKGGIE